MERQDACSKSSSDVGHGNMKPVPLQENICICDSQSCLFNSSLAYQGLQKIKTSFVSYKSSFLLTVARMLAQDQKQNRKQISVVEDVAK